MKKIKATATVPAIAKEKRQSRELSPNNRMPTAINHFPNGGWTTNSPSLPSISTPTAKKTRAPST